MNLYIYIYIWYKYKLKYKLRSRLISFNFASSNCLLIVAKTFQPLHEFHLWQDLPTGSVAV